MKYDSDRFTLAATDLTNHLSCHHLTQLNRKVAMGQMAKPRWHDPMMDVLRERGMEHEKAYVEHLRAQGKQVVDLRGKDSEAMVEAMRSGAEVLVQAGLGEGPWRGIADILLKVDGQSRFGPYCYEVQDTKLTQNTKAETILQLCLYTDLLSGIQGGEAESMSVIKRGNPFEREAFRYLDYRAYYRLVKKRFEETMAGPDLPTYPEPVEHCQICSWWQECDKKRHMDDYLSLVAGMQSIQIEELKSQGISRLEQFAETDLILKPGRGNLEALLKRQVQARIQLEGRRRQKLLSKTLESEEGRGFHRLPEPNEGDIYLDFEGDAFFEGGGLEYLIGYAVKKEGGLDYRRIWSSNKHEEKQAFSRFMDFVKAQWEEFPGMFIYHFAPYEPSTVKRLAMIHSVYEAEVDQLARGLRFIDLHQVFKESLLASVETYSLKELEKFAAYERKLELHKASSARKRVEVALELNDFLSLDEQVIAELEAYNEDDCRSTAALHQWLEEKRKTEINLGKPIERPLLKEVEARDETKDLDERTRKLFLALTENLNSESKDTEQLARRLLANLLDYFRREDKSAWWEYFRVHELEYDDLLEERKAIAGLEFVEELPKGPREKNPTHRYRFPPQEIRVEVEDALDEVKGKSIGQVKAISLENNTIDIKKSGLAKERHPRAVHVPERVDPRLLTDSLAAVARNLLDHGFNGQGSCRAAFHLLTKMRPDLLYNYDGPLLLQKEDLESGARRLATSLNSSVLAIQGPPGTGKTFTGAQMIVDLYKQGKKIGITAISHKVIRNLAKSVIKHKPVDLEIFFVHKGSVGDPEEIPFIREVGESDKVRAALEEGKIGCGTAWLWSEDKSEGVLDYLFIDEAGQMSLAHALAASRASKNLVLLGDPQQLEQPQKGAHPEGSDIAALSHLLDGHLTIPGTKGLFLGTSWRLHPEICKFTSELFYESRLNSKPGLERQRISGTRGFDEAGLFYVPVPHKGNQSRSDEEVAAISAIVGTLLAGGFWTDEEGKTNNLMNKDILIVAPFNAQVGALRQKLPGIEIGTVDKFQGQEAPVVIYSMTSSSAEDAPRGMNFLYNLNRLNVATSRAKCICILVASPALFEPECHSIEQMKLANALCRYKELAKEVVLDALDG